MVVRRELQLVDHLLKIHFDLQQDIFLRALHQQSLKQHGGESVTFVLILSGETSREEIHCINVMNVM